VDIFDIETGLLAQKEGYLAQYYSIENLCQGKMDLEVGQESFSILISTGSHSFDREKGEGVAGD